MEMVKDRLCERGAMRELYVKELCEIAAYHVVAPASPHGMSQLQALPLQHRPQKVKADVAKCYTCHTGKSAVIPSVAFQGICSGIYCFILSAILSGSPAGTTSISRLQLRCGGGGGGQLT